MKIILFLTSVVISGCAYPTSYDRHWVKVPRRHQGVNQDLMSHPLQFKTSKSRESFWVALKVMSHRSDEPWQSGCQVFIYIPNDLKKKFRAYFCFGQVTMIRNITNQMKSKSVWTLKQNPAFELSLLLEGEEVARLIPQKYNKRPIVQFYVDSSDHSTTHYRLQDGSWKAVEKVVLDYDIQMYPLQFTTNTSAGVQSKSGGSKVVCFQSFLSEKTSLVSEANGDEIWSDSKFPRVKLMGMLTLRHYMTQRLVLGSDYVVSDRSRESIGHTMELFCAKNIDIILVLLIYMQKHVNFDPSSN